MATGSGVSVDVSQLIARIEEIRKRGASLAPTMAVIAEHLVAAVNDEFASAGRGQWAPIAESTLRGRRGSSAQILMDTGRFAASIRANSGDDFAEAATDVSYAVFHVSEAPRSVIPLRDPFDIDPARLDEAEMMLIDGILRSS